MRKLIQEKYCLNYKRMEIRLMRKALLCLIILITIISFGYTKNLSVSDFYIIENNNKISLGDSLKKYYNSLDLDNFTILSFENMKFKVFNFDWGQAYTSFFSDDFTIYGFVLKNSEAKIIDGIKVGLAKDIVLTKLGSPHRREGNTFFYYNDDFDVLELKIVLVNGKISEINLFMGT